MKNQFSLFFVTFAIVFLTLFLVFYIAFYSGIRQANVYLSTVSEYYYYIENALFSPQCIGLPSYPTYVVNLTAVQEFSEIYNSSLPNCTIFPYPFRVYIGNYSFGINNINIDCQNITNIVVVGGYPQIFTIEICQNYYSYFYNLLYDFCIGEINETFQTISFLYLTIVNNTEVCSEGICSYLPCSPINGTFIGLSNIYLSK